MKIVAVTLIVIIALSFGANSIYVMRHAEWLAPASSLNITQGEVPQLMDWLKHNVPNSTRIVFEEYPGETQLFSLSMLYTGNGEIGSDYLFWWPGANSSHTVATSMFQGMQFNSSTFETLKGLNARYIVAWSNQSKAALLGANQSVSLVKQISFFSIFELRNYTPSYASLSASGANVAFLPSAANATVVEFQPEKIVVQVTNVTAGSELVVKMEYYHNWRAYTSYGQNLAVEPFNQSLPLVNVSYIGVPLSHSGSYNITLRYVEAGTDTIGLIISLVSLALVGGTLFILIDRSRRNRLTEQ